MRNVNECNAKNTGFDLVRKKSDTGSTPYWSPNGGAQLAHQTRRVGWAPGPRKEKRVMRNELRVFVVVRNGGSKGGICWRFFEFSIGTT